MRKLASHLSIARRAARWSIIRPSDCGLVRMPMNYPGSNLLTKQVEQGLRIFR